ncbi:DsbE family thiol:disulfide interchange protein [Neptunomonas marina]|uniref:DsbE family thiol:disulfide interchange protein n=1 Tax=Neptunomonas marina TaxID=1815562 RepID=A0A437Q6Z4_9GAMM|nr:DsbE family thiol:disulfide interchange protein [Neptunomonas marina]RVU30294.1 DsbE family thiol:disulfide interchange protein [Neptunomonas marina]
MRRLILFIPLVVFMALGVLFYKGLQLDPSELESALLDKPFPAFSAPSLSDENQLVTEQDLKGKPALVNVWATWCPTCKQEHAQLNRIAREEGVIIYGINYKDDRSAAKEWLRRYSDPYVLNIFDADGALGVNLGVYGAPETYVIDANGVIRYKHVGAVDEKVWQTLKGVLAEVSL